MNIDRFISMLFEATSTRISEYDGVHERILFREHVNFTAQYRYEHRSFEQCAILHYVY